MRDRHNHTVPVETRADRAALVADAGWGRLSLFSVLAGVFAAYGAFTALAAVTTAVLDAADVQADLAARWSEAQTEAAVVVGVLLLAAYVFGGYVAGRMARRSGALHGLATFVLAVAVAVAAGLFVRALAGEGTTTSFDVRDLGIPTTAAEWRDAGTIAGLVSLAVMLVGSLAGGVLGERWHTKLLARAVDPAYGSEAESRRLAQARVADADDRHQAALARVRAASPTRARRVDEDGDGWDDADTVTLTEPAAGDDRDDDGDRDERDDRDDTRPVSRVFRRHPERQPADR
jgi:hypothetical protein